MNLGVLLLALLCPLGASEVDCQPDTARIAIAHPAPARSDCGAVLMQLQMEVAASAEQPGPGEGWRFICQVRR
jgi:hypothetical protein